MITLENLYRSFEELGIQVKTHEHVPVFTVEEAEKIDAEIPGARSKNLFLKTDKRSYVLVTLLCWDRLDLKAFAKAVGLGKTSFASSEALMEHLGVIPGSVTPFGLLHPNARNIPLYIDAEMMEQEWLNFHPLKNDRTTTIHRDDFQKWLQKLGQSYEIVQLPKISKALSTESP